MLITLKEQSKAQVHHSYLKNGAGTTVNLIVAFAVQFYFGKKKVMLSLNILY